MPLTYIHPKNFVPLDTLDLSLAARRAVPFLPDTVMFLSVRSGADRDSISLVILIASNLINLVNLKPGDRVKLEVDVRNKIVRLVKDANGTKLVLGLRSGGSHYRLSAPGLVGSLVKSRDFGHAEADSQIDGNHLEIVIPKSIQINSFTAS